MFPSQFTSVDSSTPKIKDAFETLFACSIIIASWSCIECERRLSLWRVISKWEVVLFSLLCPEIETYLPVQAFSPLI
jgi:hypothetical protein